MTATAAIVFPCPACQANTRVPNDWAGRAGLCPRCRERVEVPKHSQPTPPAAATVASPLTRACDSCGERVREAAKKCLHCGDYADPTLRQRQPGEGNFRLASPLDRLLAYLLDMGLTFGPVFAVPFLASLREDLAGVAMLGALGWAFVVSSFNWSLIAREGSTIGKRWRKIRVVREDGQPVDFVYGVVLRNWIPNCMAVFGNMFYVVGCMWIALDKLFILGDDRRCLHDHLATTRVVEAGHWKFEGMQLPDLAPLTAVSPPTDPGESPGAC